MKRNLQIATGVAVGIIAALIILSIWNRPDKAAENDALMRQYRELGAACLDTPPSETAKLACQRAIEVGCEVAKRGLIGNGHSPLPTECSRR